MSVLKRGETGVSSKAYTVFSRIRGFKCQFARKVKTFDKIAIVDILGLEIAL